VVGEAEVRISCTRFVYVVGGSGRGRRMVETDGRSGGAGQGDGCAPKTTESESCM
jgi:hypothetical protein